MLFQWYLFVFLILLWAVANVCDQRYEIRVAGEDEGRYTPLISFLIAAVLTCVAAMRPEKFIDTQSYIRNYMASQFSWDGVWRTLTGNGKDKAFYIVTSMLRVVFGDHYRIYLGVIAGFCMLCVFRVYRKYSCSLFLTAFLFLASGEYVMWTHNGIRQFLAVSMIFGATDLLLQKRYLPYILVIGIASTFHGSALVMLPVMFVVRGRAWNFKTLSMMMGILALTCSSDVLMELLICVMEHTQYSNDVGDLLSTGGTSVFRVLVFAIPPVMALIFRREIRMLNIPIINLAVNMSAVSLGFYIISMFTSGIFIGRIPVYFSLYNYLLLPWIINRFFEKHSAGFIHFCVICCYMLYYYYQMHVVWRDVTAL